MAANQELLQTVLQESRLSEKMSLAQKIYRDEPILMTASQMSNFTPPIYKKMREIAHQCFSEPENVIFYKQAKFMENYEEDSRHQVDFLRYYPTYASMSDAQLRAYFSWRTKVRAGDIQKTSLSFAYIYLYEMLNGIGCQSAEDGFIQLLHFWQEYKLLDSHIGIYMKRWLKDYCIYYNLPSHYLQLIPDSKDGIMLSALLNCENENNENVFHAIQSISNYRFQQSLFFKMHPQECISVTADIVRKLNDYYSDSNKFTSREYFFGTFNEGKRMLFAGAVFYDHLRRTDYVYHVSDLEKYKCNNGQWEFSQFFLFSGKSQKAGELLRTIDCKMRTALHFKKPLKTGGISPEWEQIIDFCIDNYLTKKRFEEAPKIEIDLSLLNAIRSDSAVTQDRLLIYQDEQMRDEEITSISTVPNNNTSISDVHFAFLMHVLNGTSYSDLLKKNNLTASIIADQINEVLFDEFGDTVLDFDGDTPYILEDYCQEVKGYLGL